MGKRDKKINDVSCFTPQNLPMATTEPKLECKSISGVHVGQVPGGLDYYLLPPVVHAHQQESGVEIGART